MGALTERRASALWVVLLTAASTVTTLALACATPFPALAALAAVHMRRGDGVALMLLAWAASQIVGFCLLDYPTGAETIGWAASLAMASVLGALAAHGIVRREAGRPFGVRLALAYGAAFAVFKLVVLAWSLGLGGAGSAMAADVLLRQFVRNGAILIGLLALYHGLVALGMPRAGGLRARAA